jgi:hypothetical protein
MTPAAKPAQQQLEPELELEGQGEHEPIRAFIRYG